jgi:hypothetical protein
MSTLEEFPTLQMTPAPQKRSNRKTIAMILGILACCFCALVIGSVGGGIALKNSWATATKQEQNVRETATKQEAYAQATSTKQEEFVRATATKLEQFARATATKQEQYAQVTAQADTIFGMVPDGIANRFPNVFYYEPFDSAGRWTVGQSDNDYWVGDKSISTSYIWTIDTVKQDFIVWEFLPSVGARRDFYFQTDVRLVEGSPSDSCYGISFHHTNGDDFYALIVCEESYYVGTLKNNDWIPIRDWKRNSLINTSGMNQLGVSAEGQNFEIYINTEMIYSFMDDTLQPGRFSVLIQKLDKSVAQFEFDNIIVLTK